MKEPVDYIVASGALSLGTTAGTDRSISAEFGGTVPHALSEYYDAATGVPASGTIDFSDFHGTSSKVPPPDPPVTSCLWAHYDTYSCSIGSCDHLQTSSHAMCQNCLCVGNFRCDCRDLFEEPGNDPLGCGYNPRFRTIQNRSGHDIRAWTFPCMTSACSKDNTGFWGTGSTTGQYPNTVIMVMEYEDSGCWLDAACRYDVIERFNTGYDGVHAFNTSYFRPDYSGYVWRITKPIGSANYYSGTAPIVCYWILRGSDKPQVVEQVRVHAPYTTTSSSDALKYEWNPVVKGHRIFARPGYNEWAFYNENFDQGVQQTWLTRTSSVNNMGYGYSGNAWCGDSNQTFYCRGIYKPGQPYHMMRCAAVGECGKDIINGVCNHPYYGDGTLHCGCRTAHCYNFMEYYHYKCALTDTEMCTVMEHLRNKWHCDCYAP